MRTTVTIKGTTAPVVKQYTNPKFYNKMINLDDVYELTKAQYPDEYYNDYKYYSNKLIQIIMFSQPKGLIINVKTNYNWEQLLKQATVLGIPVKLIYNREELVVKAVVTRTTHTDNFGGTFKILQYPFTRTTADVFTETETEYTYSVTGQKIVRPTDEKEIARLHMVKEALEELRKHTLKQMWAQFNEDTRLTTVWKAEMYNDYLLEEHIKETKAIMESYKKTNNFYKKCLTNITFDSMVEQVTLYGPAYDIPVPTWFKATDIGSYDIAKGYKEYSKKGGFNYTQIGKAKAYLNNEKRTMVNYLEVVDSYLMVKTLEAKKMLADGWTYCKHCGEPHRETDIECTHCGQITIDIEAIRQSLIDLLNGNKLKQEVIKNMSNEELLTYYTAVNGIQMTDVNPGWFSK